jgi:hypothetical protein
MDDVERAAGSRSERSTVLPDMPTVAAFNFVLRGALDAQGKSLSSLLLEMEIEG